MEPTKNTNSNNESSEPVFHGMPKPGQPLASTPRVKSNPLPSVAQTNRTPTPTPTQFRSQTPDAHPTFSEIMSSGATRPTAPTAPSNLPTSSSPSPFSAHSPSALDRIMNPNLAQNTAVPPTPVSPAPSSASVQTPVQPSVFKPYTPPASPVSKPVSAPTPAATATALNAMPTSGYKVGAPITNSYSNTNGIPPAPSASVTAAKLGNEVNAILNNQQNTSKKHKGTIAWIIGAILVLLLLAGGGYYWYTYMYLPSTLNTEETTQNPTGAMPVQTNTSSNNSLFPTSATKPPVATPPIAPSLVKPVATQTTTKTTKPAQTTKPTRVITPFNQAQRDAVSTYIYNNINKLAYPKSKTAYGVTDITFDGPDRAVVQYSDNKYSYTAIAVASIDTANKVSIVSFSLLEK